MATYFPEGNIGVVVIEENSTEREYLLALVARTPGVKLLAAYGGLADTLRAVQKELPDLVIVGFVALNDLVLGWLRTLRSILPHTSVLVLSAEENRDQILQGLEAGVCGWLQKPCPADQIARAIFILHGGGAVLSSAVARRILDYFHARGSSVDCLSNREREVLGLLARGQQATDISTKLGLSISTVRTHVRNLLSKLKVTSRTEAVAKYLNPVEDPR